MKKIELEYELELQEFIEILQQINSEYTNEIIKIKFGYQTESGPNVFGAKYYIEESSIGQKQLYVIASRILDVGIE